MKKSKFLAVILLAVFLIRISFVPSYALPPTEEQSINGTQVNQIFKTYNFASYYFYNLRENLGYNIASSCGYVAFGMLLSFYDIYWDPHFIPDYYLQTTTAILPFNLMTASPGIVSDYEIADVLDPMDTAPGELITDYFNYVQAHKTDYFHFYLMNIGIDKHYTYPVSGAFTVFSDQLENVMEHYLLYGVGNNDLSDNVSLVNCTQSSDHATILQIANLIDEGIPVLLAGYSDDGAHAMIAYDYSEDSDGNIELYVHMGYVQLPQETHVALSTTEYSSSLEAYYLDVRSEHLCSESYIVEDAGSYFCSCSFGVHPSHVHDYVFKQYNSAKHKKECRLCGSYDLVAHIVAVGGTTCIKCGETVSTDGPILILGDKGNSPYLINAGISPYIVEYITEQGSYLLSNGVIVLTHYDMEEYLSGNLDISQYTDQEETV